MKIIKNSIIYLSSSVISKGAPFILLPFLTSYLEPEEFGVLAVFLVINAFYGAVIGMSMHANITKNFFHRTKPDLATIAGNVYFILFITTIFYLLVTLLLMLFINNFFSIPIKYLLISPVIAFFGMANQIYLTVLRNEGRAYAFGMFEITNAFFSMAATLFFLIYLDYGWPSQVFGVALTSIVLSVIGVTYLYKNNYLNFTFSKQESSSILRLSVPLIPHVIGGTLIAMSDRLFIERMVGLESVALYSIGYSFGMIVSLFVDSLIKAWSPWFYKQLAKPTYERKKKIVKSTYAYLISIFILALVISIVGKFILPYVVAESYDGASRYILWIALGYAVQGVYKIFFPYLVHISKTGFLAFSTMIAATTNLIFNFILISKYGAIGSAYATILSFAVSALLVFEYQRRNYWMPWLLRPQAIKSTDI